MYHDQGQYLPPPSGQGEARPPPPLPPRPASTHNPNQTNNHYQPNYYAHHGHGSPGSQASPPLPGPPPPIPPLRTHPNYYPHQHQQTYSYPPPQSQAFQPTQGQVFQDRSPSTTTSSNSYSHAPQAYVRPAARIPDPMQGLASEFGQMNMGQSGSYSAAAPEPSRNNNKSIRKNRILPVPLICESGEPNNILYNCPEDRALDYETFWYHLKDVPDFLVCTRCHDTHIAGTNLDPSFRKTLRPTGRCRFNVPRVTDVLLPDAMETGSLDSLKYYMTLRLRIKDCAGEQGATGEEVIKWFKPALDEIDDFVACEACYEDVVKSTSFSTYFAPDNRRQMPGINWLCDLSIPFVQRSLLEYAKSPQGWSDWIAAATRRVQLPICQGDAVEVTSRQWVRPRRQIGNIAFCEACYLDKVALTVFDHEFEFIPQQPKKPSIRRQLVDLLADSAHQDDMWVCDNKFSLSLSMALEVAIERQDFNIFYNAAQTIVFNPRCTAGGITGGTWYTLKGGSCPEFQVCAGCHGALFVSLNLGQFLERAHNSSAGGSQAVLCNYNPTHRNFLPCVLRQAEAVETGVWSPFSTYVRARSSVQPCPREQLVPNRRWYGYGDLVICPSCWLSFCQSPAVLSIQPGLPNVPIQNDMVQKTRMCSLYSPRMRQKWREACRAGSADELLAFSRLRMEVYAETVLQIKMIESMKLIQCQQAMNDATLSIVYQGMAGRRMLAGTTDAYWHGNSRVGWHATEEGATSSALRMRMQSGLRNATDMGGPMTIPMLRLRWAEVE